MRKIIDVNTGKVFVGRGNMILRFLAIDSYIAIAIFDHKTRNTGLTHIMLTGHAKKY